MPNMTKSHADSVLASILIEVHKEAVGVIVSALQTDQCDQGYRISQSPDQMQDPSYGSFAYAEQEALEEMDRIDNSSTAWPEGYGPYGVLLKLVENGTPYYGFLGLHSTSSSVDLDQILADAWDLFPTTHADADLVRTSLSNCP